MRSGVQGWRFVALAVRLLVAMRVLATSAALLTSALWLWACPGPPTGSISHRPNNVYDEGLYQLGPSAAARWAQESLAKSYPTGSESNALVAYLEKIGSECARDGETTTVCHMKSYFEMKFAYWFFNATVATGKTLERIEYTFTTTVETAGGKIKSIGVTKVENRLE